MKVKVEDDVRNKYRTFIDRFKNGIVSSHDTVTVRLWYLKYSVFMIDIQICIR